MRPTPGHTQGCVTYVLLVLHQGGVSSEAFAAGVGGGGAQEGGIWRAGVAPSDAAPMAPGPFSPVVSVASSHLAAAASVTAAQAPLTNTDAAASAPASPPFSLPPADTGLRMAFTGDALLIRGCGRTDFQVLYCAPLSAVQCGAVQRGTTGLHVWSGSVWCWWRSCLSPNWWATSGSIAGQHITGGAH